LIIFTCFIKTCLFTRNWKEAINTYRLLKDYSLSPDSITFNTILKGLNINKAYEEIPRIIKDSLKNKKCFCSWENYNEAMNNLEKNLLKTNISENEFIEINELLKSKNIYVKIENKFFGSIYNSNNYNSNSNSNNNNNNDIHNLNNNSC
jgi:DNA replicative helicase MCM subunit Mcm2 (Cdc46/Mcm family)